MVVDASLQQAAWRGRLMDLRIEDHPDPVPELRRIVTLQLAYELLNDEGDAAKAGQSAEERYAEARRLAPDAYELASGAPSSWRTPATRPAHGARSPSPLPPTTPGSARWSTWPRPVAKASPRRSRPSC